MAGHLASDEELYNERIQRFCLMDDVFMTAFFNDNKPCMEYVLRIIMGKPGLVVKSVQVQKELKNLHGRSVRLDADTVDEDGEEADVEVQRDDRGANPGRARYYSSLLDSNVTYPIGKYCEKLKKNYVIFITENDVLGGGQPLYFIRRHIEMADGSCRPFNDGSIIIYVNGAMRDEQTPLGRLMHDFFCTRAADMYSPLLAERMRDLKESEKGVLAVSSVVDEIRNEAMCEMAIRMLSLGKYPHEDIAQCTELDLATVERLAAEMTAAS